MYNTAFNQEARDAHFLAEFNRELEYQAEKLDTSSTALKLYASTIAGVKGELKELNQETAKQAAEEYEFNKSYNEGVEIFEDVKDSYDKWIKSIKSGGKQKISFDVADEVAELKDSLEEIFWHGNFRRFLLWTKWFN